MLEFHIHGGLAVKSRMLNALSKIKTFREAEPVSNQSLSIADLICFRVSLRGGLFSMAS